MIRCKSGRPVNNTVRYIINMKTGDKIAITIINQRGRRVDTISAIRLKEEKIFADVTPESSGGALKQMIAIELIARFMEPVVGESEFRYRGEIQGAVFLPDFYWK